MQPETAQDTAATPPKPKPRAKRRPALEDGRSQPALRRRALVKRLQAELTALGRPQTVRDQLLMESLATASIRLEQIRGDLSRGLPVSDEELVRMSNCVARLISSLGLKAAPAKPPGPSLAQYLANKSGESTG